MGAEICRTKAEEGKKEMANETVFTEKAAEYARSRPAYAPQAVEKVLELAGSTENRIGDMGSGTGILSGVLLSRGYEVFCVEPNAAMRARAEATYGQNPRFHSVPASAEHTGLPAESLSLITAASSFHWLDTALFHSECCRLMKPGGIVCILANVRRHDAFTRAQHALCLRYCPGYTSLTHGAEKVQARAGAFFKGGYAAETFSFPLQYSREGFISPQPVLLLWAFPGHGGIRRVYPGAGGPAGYGYGRGLPFRCQRYAPALGRTVLKAPAQGHMYFSSCFRALFSMRETCA